jgi:pSer/pThr/pTyr-binding forkhead associated (FHA) protein
LTLEVIEGPGAGKQILLDRPITIGRGTGADLQLDDGEVSRNHAKVTPEPDGSVTIEDLGSTHGTFVNHNELMGPAKLDAGDELLLGVTVIKLRSPDDVATRMSAVIQVPPALAMAARPPTYVNPEVVRQETEGAHDGGSGIPDLEKYLDVRVRRRAQLAPLAMLILVAIALGLYFAIHRGGL